MTGPEHYVQAEMLLAGCGFRDAGEAGEQVDPQITPSWLAAAQVHATLALAAATALNPTGEDFISQKHWPEYKAWANVCSVNPPVVAS